MPIRCWWKRLNGRRLLFPSCFTKIYVIRSKIQGANFRFYSSVEWEYLQGSPIPSLWHSVISQKQNTEVSKYNLIIIEVLYSIYPVYLKERLHPHHSARTLRSSTEGLLSVPSLREAKLQGTRQRAFSVVAPALWNALPSQVREINNYLTFRKNLKAALFREVFNV